MENMAIKEAEAVLFGTENYYYDGRIIDYNKYSNAVDTVKAVLEKVDKYRWHDLCEDPDDLPEEEEEYRTELFKYSVDVLCVTLQGEYVTAFTKKDEDGSLTWYDNYSGRELNPIVWKYIEPFI